jgi:hypothetical protein
LKPQHTGLEAVSRTGADVFFSTYETLVSEDHNGEFVKFYDARTGGGFANDPEPAPCTAADECHGEGSSAPSAAVATTGTDLGPGGNVVSHPTARHKKHRKRHHRRRHRGKQHHRKQSHRGKGSRSHG